ncbi:Spc98 family-domain-containing protein [Geopyxis carbonaria]|nr:Spc98 family-domain-containing protein [Geopyxis carbonaria]
MASEEPSYTALFPSDEPSRREGHPFLIPDLWRPSTLAPDLAIGSTLFKDASFLITAATKNSNPTAFTFTAQPLPSKDGTLFELPTDFGNDAPSLLGRQRWLEGEDDFPPSVVDEDEEEEVRKENEEEASMVEEDGHEKEEDVWLLPETRKPPEQERVHTWESFLVDRETENRPANPYISEAGPKILDAALEEQMGEEAGVVIRTDIFCTCLLHLGLGRSSLLFVYDHTKDRFRPVKEKLKISGCTVGTVESLVKAFAECGTGTKRLERFAYDVYKNTATTSPSLVALAKCITTIVEAIQKRLSLSYSTIRSVLHLHSLILEPALIVDAFLQLSQAVQGAENDSQLLSKLFEAIQQQQHRSGWLRPLLVETLAMVSRPWLETVEQWIGLDHGLGGLGAAEAAARGLFVHIEQVTELDENGKERTKALYTFDKARIPSFLSEESAETMFETGRSLRYLETYHPNHPLATASASRERDVPKLEWKFSWEDLENLQQQATTHERTLRAAIKKYTAQTPESVVSNDSGIDMAEVPSPFETFGRTPSEITSHLTTSAAAMSIPLPTVSSSPQDTLTTIVLSASTDVSTSLTTFAPPLPITPLISFSPILSVQSTLINKATLRMFFTEHHLRAHLSLLRRFMLFGDGVFSSRLASSLFSADADGTERRSGRLRTGGSMGLKLGSRTTWPPASSELRLALMDVLTSSFTGTSGGLHSAGKTASLPGGLSFAVREMSAAELAACHDPDGISALDFLRLEYRPPAPLDAVITRDALWRYDKIFRLLLRTLRMLFVVNTSLHHTTPPGATARRFATEARHFVTTLTSYMLTSGIGTTWTRFERALEACATVEALRAAHEAVLDRIMFATLSRKRQAPVMGIVEEVFGLVLRFARYCRVVTERGQEKEGGNSGEEGEQEYDLEAQYKAFRRRVRLFINVCRGLSEKRGYGEGRKDLEGRRAVDGVFGTGYKEEANLLGMLLLGLEMNGYYTKDQ